MNENGEMFAETCAKNNLMIRGSVFPHKTIQKNNLAITRPCHRKPNGRCQIKKRSRRSLRPPPPCRVIQAKAEETPSSPKSEDKIPHRVPHQCSSGKEPQRGPLKRK